jgi:hypothetical protein
VVAGGGDDVDGLGGARVVRVDGEQLARQRVRLGIDGIGAEELRPDVVQLQPAAHVGLVDEPQHRRPVLIGHSSRRPAPRSTFSTARRQRAWSGFRSISSAM